MTIYSHICRFEACVLHSIHLIMSLLHQVIAESLSEPEVSLSDHLPLLQQLLHCISVTISAAGENSRLQSGKFFSVLLRVAAVKHGEAVKKQVCSTSSYMYVYTCTTLCSVLTWILRICSLAGG